MSVRSDQRDAPADTAQGQRNTALSRAGQTRRDAVDQFYRNPVCLQPLRLFAAAPKNARIAAFEAHHAFALTDITQHQAMDKGLRR